MGRAVDQLLSLAAVRVEGYTRVVNGRTVQVSSYIRGGGKGFTPEPFDGPPAAPINDWTPQPAPHPNVATVDVITQPIRDALRFYQGIGYEEINESLRHGGALSPEAATHRDNMFALMERSRTKEPMTLYRMASSGIDMKVGEDFKDNGFISTAHGDDPDVIEEFNENSPGPTAIEQNWPAVRVHLRMVPHGE